LFVSEKRELMRKNKGKIFEGNRPECDAKEHAYVCQASKIGRGDDELESTWCSGARKRVYCRRSRAHQLNVNQGPQGG
jgi:hypothetical protein